MALDQGIFCRVFIDHKGSVESIEKLLGDAMGVATDDNGEFSVSGLSLSIDHGDTHPPVEERDYTDWINWKYSLEVSWPESTDHRVCADGLIPILEGLKNAGVKAVPACDFEDLLSPFNWTDERAPA